MLFNNNNIKYLGVLYKILLFIICFSNVSYIMYSSIVIIFYNSTAMVLNLIQGRTYLYFHREEAYSVVVEVKIFR